ncbi:MAG TPA: hypothetical protein VKV36_09515 [Acidimicrobiales bacterium]|nr:hypothetical protein [Acidimicrobiales bacterium]
MHTPTWLTFPLFAVAFAEAVGINTIGLVPRSWHAARSSLAPCTAPPAGARGRASRPGRPLVGL